MADEEIERTFKEKLLFYTTASFVLLGTFSLFGFLFLVPFVIDPALTTIFMEFNETPALCVTTGTESNQGVSNCSWTSCREGCTREIFTCTQIRVNYKILPVEVIEEILISDTPKIENEMENREVLQMERYARAIRDYEYTEEQETRLIDMPAVEPTGLMGNNSEWYFTGAKLFPNVKGCGYPPMLNCTIFYKKYTVIGYNFSCYYSTVDPGIVINELDMWQTYMNLIYAMAIPIPSFIISVIYLTFAYFKIYNEDEETAPLEANAEEMDVEGANTNSLHSETLLPQTSGVVTPGSEVFREDLASFGHQLKVKMADEMSRESLVDSVPSLLPTSMSIPG